MDTEHIGAPSVRSANQEPAVLEAFVVDVNGIARGKWVPADRIGDVMRKGIALPRSVFALDVWGCDVVDAGLAIGTGDPDGICMPVEGSLLPVTWLSRPTHQVLLNMLEQDGSPFYGDPRQVLARVMGFYREAGLTPCIERAERGGENGPGQYEVNLKHVPDPLAAADHAFLLKRIVKGVARKHGWDATFMAKPYGHLAGSGMHVHMSVLDRNGRNIMAEPNGAPSGRLLHAVGGMMATMADAMLLLAPHANSYRRLCPGTHAPTNITWGLDNRTAALRVITAGQATRVEHRVAGADCNPYLAVAGILAGLMHGLENEIDPGRPIDGEELVGHPTLPFNWDDAIDAFDASKVMAKYLGDKYQDLFSATKAQEQAEFRKRVTDVEYDAYLSSV